MSRKTLRLQLFLLCRDMLTAKARMPHAWQHGPSAWLGSPPPSQRSCPNQRRLLAVLLPCSACTSCHNLFGTFSHRVRICSALRSVASSGTFPFADTRRIDVSYFVSFSGLRKRLTFVHRVSTSFQMERSRPRFWRQTAAAVLVRRLRLPTFAQKVLTQDGFRSCCSSAQA